MAKKFKYVAGIDASLTGTGVAVVGAKTGKLYKVATIRNDPSKFNKIERAVYISNRIIEIINSFRIGPVFIEGYAFMGRGRGMLDLAQLGGIIRLRLLEVGHTYYEIPPTLLKKFVTGKGNAAKNIMLEKVFRKFGLGSEDLVDDNQVDAYSLARFGQKYLEGKGVTKEQEICFKKAGEMVCFDRKKV